MDQKLLDVSHKSNAYLEDDFIISDCNKNAYNKLLSFPNDWGINPYSKILWLKGDRYSGKTHLCNILKNRFINKVFVLKKNNILSTDFISSKKLHILVIDDAERWDEEVVFHQFNLCFEEKIHLLITSDKNWTAKLPDLKSRLLSLESISLDKPDDEMINIMISLEFSKRSLKINSEVIDFLKNNLPRNYENIKLEISKIDNLFLKNKKKLSLLNIKKYFKEK